MVRWTTIAIAGCATLHEPLTLDIVGSPEVQVEALGPVNAPEARLSDGTMPMGIVWSVETTQQVARIQGPKVIAVGVGETDIIGQWEDQQVQWRLTVTPPMRLIFTDAPESMEVGESAQLSVQSLQGDDVLAPPTEVTWTARPVSVLQVSEDGQVSGLSAGIGWVTAHTDGAEAMVEITVQSTR